MQGISEISCQVPIKRPLVMNQPQISKLIRKLRLENGLTQEQFAAELGVLFQIVDDILDVTGTDVALGKPRGSDERHGKRTYVSEFGLARARELARESHERARASLAAALGPQSQAEDLENVTDFIFTRTS